MEIRRQPSKWDHQRLKRNRHESDDDKKACSRKSIGMTSNPVTRHAAKEYTTEIRKHRDNGCIAQRRTKFKASPCCSVIGNGEIFAWQGKQISRNLAVRLKGINYNNVKRNQYSN